MSAPKLIPNTGLWVCLLLSMFSCTKQEIVVVPDNDPPITNNVPAIKIENYVNRIFIDLLGREPLDEEMVREVQALRDDGLDKAARISLIQKLQTDTEFLEGDTSYTQAYHQYLYNLAKIRCLEGVSEEQIEDEIGNADDSLEILRLQAVIDSRLEMQNGQIDVTVMFARMVHNHIYDQINMNTFNFVNATFDNLYWRYPTNAEFQAGFSMVENNQPQTLLGETGSNKDDYVHIITGNEEMFEGLIIWAYQQLLSRRPTTPETIELLADFLVHRDIKQIQQQVMATDEYANF